MFHAILRWHARREWYQKGRFPIVPRSENSSLGSGGVRVEDAWDVGKDFKGPEGSDSAGFQASAYERHLMIFSGGGYGHSQVPAAAPAPPPPPATRPGPR